MIHWVECQDGFFLPRSMDCFDFPPYAEWDPEIPDWTEMVNIAGLLRPPAWAWAAWFNAQRNDKPLKMDPGLAQQIAIRVYDMERFKHIIPAWRRWMLSTLNEIDDIEDQVSTVVWLAETVFAKWIPIPRGALDVGRQLSRTLDQATVLLAGVPRSRGSKAEFAAKRRELAASKRGARARLSKLIIWMRENWGHLLEAAQATNTWFDVGIVLGPVMAFIEDGLWAIARQTVNNFLTAAETVLPGYTLAYNEKLDEYAVQIDAAWDATYENVSRWGEAPLDGSPNPWDPFNETGPF